jgi:hypothetical protein
MWDIKIYVRMDSTGISLYHPFKKCRYPFLSVTCISKHVHSSIKTILTADLNFQLTQLLILLDEVKLIFHVQSSTEIKNSHIAVLKLIHRLNNRMTYNSHL